MFNVRRNQRYRRYGMYACSQACALKKKFEFVPSWSSKGFRMRLWAFGLTSPLRGFAGLLCAQLCFENAAAFLTPMPGPGRGCGSRCGHISGLPSAAIAQPAWGEDNGPSRRNVALRAKLTRQHDFGIDPKKVGDGPHSLHA